MKVIINTSLMVPIYEQITDQIKTLIRNGELKENDNLPSVRTLSKELKISALTVKKAYDSLESEGFTITVHGKGTYVAAANPELLLEEQKKELEAIEGAKVETVQDANNLQAIKVTFDNGILFATNKSELSPASREALIKFANSLKNSPDTDVTIYGHTDNTGSRAVNERISKERADAVANYLVSQGISRSRMTTEGLAFDQPVADNSTASGRAQNRRVEVYITANADMIRKAQNGQLN